MDLNDACSDGTKENNWIIDLFHSLPLAMVRNITWHFKSFTIGLNNEIAAKQSKLLGKK